MCNEYERYVDRYAYCKLMQDPEWGTPTPQSERDLPQTGSVRIRNVAPVIRAAGNGVELAQMRWSFPPPRPGGKPVFNFRSEGRSFRDSRRRRHSAPDRRPVDVAVLEQIVVPLYPRGAASFHAGRSEVWLNGR